MDDGREIDALPPAMPAGLAAHLAGCDWRRDTVGESGGNVFRVRMAGAADRYLKHGTGTVAQDVTDEMGRLRWLHDRVAVPQVEYFVAPGDGDAWLLMSALPGRTAWQVMDAEPATRIAIAVALADFLRRLHELPVAECPFNSAHPLRLAHAHRRMERGEVDTDDFGERHKGWSAERLWAAMQRLLPLADDPVVTHGDFSLDNILIDGGAVVGCIDVGRVGIADRYQDVAILWDSLGEFGATVQAAFAHAYGIAIDQRKIDFHLCLDEFF